jgi:hypothetical protein
MDRRYIAERRRIEESHGDDDGTECHFCREMRRREMYRERETPVTEDSPVSALERYGMTDQLRGVLDAAGFETVADLRRELLAGRLVKVRHIGARSAKKAAAVLRRLDEENKSMEVLCENLRQVTCSSR